MPINYEQPSTWVAVHDGRLCPDCAKLAGKTMTVAEWVESGVLPGNGQTICGEWCRCMLVPQEWASEFGDPPTVDTSVKAIQGLMHTYNAAMIPQNVRDRWEVMQEREPGFAPDVETDISRTVEYLNNDPDGLRTLYPRHYQLISTLLNL